MKRILLFAVLCAVTPLCAATLTVTNLNDTGAGSLRAQCAAAASGDTIVFQTGLAGTIAFGSEINLGTKVLTITGNDNGAGAPAITLNAVTSTRFLNTQASLTVNLLAFTNGQAAASRGGSIQIADDPLTCNDCTFSGNGALQGGAIGTLGGATSTITCTGCTFTANAVTGSGQPSGGAIYGNLVTCTNCRFHNHSCTGNNTFVYGGAIFAESATCTNCAFTSNNLQADVNNQAHGGAIWAATSVTCTNSTFSDNSSQGAASTSLVSGGAIRCDGAVNCSGCTFSANSVAGGSIGNTVGGAIAGFDVVCTDCTFAANDAPQGRCCVVFTTLMITNCIVSDTGTGSMFGGGGTLTSGGYNICTAAAGSVPWMNATGDQPGTDPLLGALQDNGGPVHTMLPASNSPAIDQGGGTTATNDARGKARPFDNTAIANATGGDGRDIGAVEFAFNAAPVIGAPASAVTPISTPRVFNNISIADADAGSGELEVSLAVTNGTLTLSGTTGLTFSAGDGTADASMTFTGTLTDLNAALNGLSFTPTAAYTGAASLQIDADDQGNSGDDSALTDTHTVNITVADLPEITLLLASVEITDGGSDNVSGPAGTAIVRTYAIRNDGITALNVGGVTFANESNCTATLTTPPAATVAPGATSDLTITITPVATGSFSFDFVIASDDADENPYNVQVVGTTPSQSAGGDSDDDDGCSTGTSRGYPVMCALALLALVAVRRRVAGRGSR
jgi:hypothetical protein